MWLLLACAAPVEAPPDLPEVVALSEPAAWVVAELAEDAVELVRFTPPGEDPPHYRPAPERIAGLVQADLIVGNGAGYEGWTATATLPEVTWMAEGLPLRALPTRAHQHGSTGAHSHGGVDPHTFGDPVLLAQGVERVAQALTALGVDGAHSRGEALQNELIALSRAQAEALAPLVGLPLASNHPSYGYLADRHGLDMHAYDLDPAAPVTVAVAEGVLWWESPPSESARASLPGVQHVAVDPLESGSPYDYLAQARANLARFASIEPTSCSTGTPYCR